MAAPGGPPSVGQARPPPSVLHTPGFAHYSVAWSPFHTQRLALASSANYGLVGNGRLHIISLAPSPPVGPPGAPTEIKLERQFDAQDGLYDVAWSEVHEHQLVTASGDGSLRLWDATLNDLPIRAWHEHAREVFSVDWSNIRKDQFASASWDGSIKLWTPELPRSITTLQAHHACAYQALFSPHTPDLLASCSTDGTLKLFDLRSPSFLRSGPGTGGLAFAQKAMNAASLTVPASGAELLTIDWNKYRPHVLASAGVDRLVRVWDCRMVSAAGATDVFGQAQQGGEAPPPKEPEPMVGGVCEAQMPGHEYAVRKVQWSPHRADVLASASYDMTCRVWTTNAPAGAPGLLYIHDAHTEFVVGCAWSLYEEGVLASCGWDAKLNVFRV